MLFSRRGFLSATIKTTLAASVGSAGAIGLVGTAAAAGGYDLINPPQNTSTPDQVEVIEFFWLGCPHCYSFEPSISAWEESKPDNVAFIREAPPLNPSWEQHSRAFYAAQLMGHEEVFVKAMFNAIHEERKNMRNPEVIAELAATLGMDKDKFRKTMDSFGVQTKLNRSMQLAKAAGLSGVPSVVINGKYLTGASLAGGNDGIINVINETIAIEKQTMGLE
ncbi:thiol:disulfide interchange protein DsbA/DsbL [Granulosicoccus antarcticus]|uniref:Thiol:disulfide interchange protein DsbA n=1 Tax=Granulosicoccus antarcticus IMCC3135 TaxID=1192854 RepID=A0A2Z2NG66_9GAMM|nr:thiol:disulfide interchange protein DsbA/DsbL [Granulosicoccus antarcticus]ASJ70266.1 Thiol:disulfide interchange protein DsbA [Granulosicoccus antarcticus IMCC3135]